LEQIEQLEWLAGIIRWNEAALRITHENLWPAGVFGFLIVGTVNLVLAVLLWTSIREGIRKLRHHD
jgi:hypothetical protein